MTCLYQEKKQEIEEMRCKEVLVLYAAKIIKLQGRTKKILVQSCVKAFSDVGSSKPSDEYCDGMQEFFAFLQPNILTPSITPYTKIPTLNPMEFQEHAFANRTPLLICIVWSCYWSVLGRQRKVSQQIIPRLSVSVSCCCSGKRFIVVLLVLISPATCISSWVIGCLWKSCCVKSGTCSLLSAFLKAGTTTIDIS
jgi:hypothetical protein